jgi:uncharacterized protein
MSYIVMKKELLIIFYRNPELGKVKTRLAATIGDERALALYFLLAKHTREITQNLSCDKVVFYSDFVDKEDAWDNNIFQKELQSGIDLGEKMQNAFSWAFDMGYQHVCIVGTDCFELQKEIIEQAFVFLKLNNAVLGPAKDGGYYLLGMNKLHSQLFKNKIWSSSEVALQTITDFNSLQLNFHALPTLSDVDTIEDLPLQLQHLLNK